MSRRDSNDSNNHSRDHTQGPPSSPSHGRTERQYHPIFAPNIPIFTTVGVNGPTPMPGMLTIICTPLTQPSDEQQRAQPERAEHTMMLAVIRVVTSGIPLNAVHSQEEMDQIITRLREAEGNTGGAPPASEAAIAKLEVREIGEAMLGSCEDDKPRCTICIEDMCKGEKASVLPCNHFFHGECVTPWLKKHNTCPVCRRSIEQEETNATDKMTGVQGESAVAADATATRESRDQDGDVRMAGCF